MNENLYANLISGINLAESLTEEEKGYLSALVETEYQSQFGLEDLLAPITDDDFDFSNWKDSTPLLSDNELPELWSIRRELLNTWINNPLQFKLETICLKVLSKDTFTYANDPAKPRTFRWADTWFAFPELKSYIQPGMELTFLGIKDRVINPADGKGNYFVFMFVTETQLGNELSKLSHKLKHLIDTDQQRLLDYCFELNQQYLVMQPE